MIMRRIYSFPISFCADLLTMLPYFSEEMENPMELKEWLICFRSWEDRTTGEGLELTYGLTNVFSIGDDY